MGRQQAQYLRGHLPRLVGNVSTCVRSDFARVAETAQLALPPGVEQHVVSALRERNRGAVAGMPRGLFQEHYPDDAAEKERDPLGWTPPGGESLLDKAESLRAELPAMGELAPDRPLVMMTSGEVVLAARSLDELGKMGNEDLKHGLAPDWPGLAVDNAQLDHYTRRTPETGRLGASFDHMRSVRAGTENATTTGWLHIRR